MNVVVLAVGGCSLTPLPWLTLDENMVCIRTLKTWHMTPVLT